MKDIRSYRVLGCIAALVVLMPAALRAETRKVRIGTVCDGPGAVGKQILQEMKREVLHLLEGEFEASFPERGKFVADWTPKGVKAAVDRALKDPGIDLVIMLGALASDEACHRKALPKPVLAPMVMDVELQDIAFEQGKSGVKNLNYLVQPWAMEQNLKVFRDIYPFRKLGFVLNKYWHERLGQVRGHDKAREIIQKHAKDFVMVPVGESGAEALAALPADVDAVYLLPLPQMSTGELDVLIRGLIEKKLPSFSAAGRPHVERGVLAGLRPGDDMIRMARQVAVNVQRILLGEDAGTLPVAFSSGSQLVINVKTSKGIGTSPPYRVLMEAELLDAEPSQGRKLSMDMAIQEALGANLDLALARHDVVVGAEEVRKARANLLPGLDLGTQTTLIDSDRAEASFGSQPEFGWTASLTLREVLAEGAFANHTIQGYLQEARRHKETEVRLDIIEAAVTAYLNVLRTGIAENIQKNNVRVSRQNLELAQKRLAIGATRLSEVYRWESAIAQQRQAVVSAHLQQSLAELELNRLLRRPLEENFVLADVEIQDLLFTGNKKSLHKLLDNPDAMRAFRDFLVREAHTASPELRQINASKAALERSIVSTRRSFWLPTFAVQAQVNQRLAETGAGTGGLDLPPDLEAMAALFPSQDDTTWNIVASLSWPLLEGGLRFAELDQSRAELSRLQTQEDRVKQLIEQRVRAALQMGTASRANINLSKSAAEAASKNLELVTDAYARGAVTILELLDAQNAALISDLARTNAEFAFALDLVSAQHAAGGYFIMLSKDDRDVWIERFEAFLAELKGK